VFALHRIVSCDCVQLWVIPGIKTTAHNTFPTWIQIKQQFPNCVCVWERVCVSVRLWKCVCVHILSGHSKVLLYLLISDILEQFDRFSWQFPNPLRSTWSISYYSLITSPPLFLTHCRYTHGWSLTGCFDGSTLFANHISSLQYSVWSILPRRTINISVCLLVQRWKDEVMLL